MLALIEWAKAHPEAATALVVALLNLASYAAKRFAPRLADTIAALVPHVGLLTDALAGRGPVASKAPDGGGKPPAPPMVVLMAVCAFGVTSCASGTQAVEAIAHAGRDVAVAAEPCLVATYDDELRQCAEAEAPEACKQAAAERWAPVLASLDTLHAAWCAVAPTSQGCP